MKYKTGMGETAWLAYTKPNPVAEVRLFCLPHAGGGAGAYRSWVAGLYPEIEVLPVQLPGRETRFLERPYHQLAPLVRDLATELRPYFQKPFALFGHSLGALIAFELARLLQSEALLPVHLFLSGYGAPHLPGKLPPMHHLDDAGFLAALQELGTTPPAVLADEELLALLLPMLRADFSVYEQYQFQAAEPLPIPITLLGGKRDPLVTPEMLAAWQVHSRQPGGMHLFAGDHFYLQGQETAVWRIIRQVCQASQTTKFNE